jgi:heat-inducible transcriptional repressor
VPTERGYRLYAEGLLDRLDPRPGPFGLDPAAAPNELETALRTTTEMLAEATRLLALVSAPSLETASVRHVEVLLLQPHVVMVVVITSTGGVTKRMFAFDAPIDVGVANWAAEYLNDRLTGAQLGSLVLRRRLADPELSARERAFLEAIAAAFTSLAEDGGERVFVGGTASLVGGGRAEEVEACRRVLGMLEKRVTLLELVGQAMQPLRPFVRVGDLPNPELDKLSLVGAGYGLPNRPLGAVGLLGPLRMDYAHAIESVRAAAHELSRVVEEVYAAN